MMTLHSQFALSSVPTSSLQPHPSPPTPPVHLAPAMASVCQGRLVSSLVSSSLPSQPATLPSASLDFFLPSSHLEPSHSPALGSLPTRDPFPSPLSSTVTQALGGDL